MLQVKHDELKEIIREYYREKLSLFIFGTFGIGKSFVVRGVAQQIAKEKNKEFKEWNRLNKEQKDEVYNNPSKYFVLIDERLSEYDGADIKGLPSFMEDSDTLNWKMPYWARFISKKDSDGVLFFDEMNLACPLVISSVYKILYDRIIGEENISKDWLIIGAGNLDSDSAFTHTLPAPVRDRGGEVTLLVGNKDNWTEWAVKNSIDSRIIAFINFKESNLHNVDFDNEQKFTTPRGWERVSRLIKDRKIDKSFEMLVCSAIGEGIAREFIGFSKLKEKVNLEEIIKNPKKIKELAETDDLGTLYLVLTAVAERFKNEKDTDFIKILEITRELDNSNKTEFVALLWKLCVTMDYARFQDGYLSDKNPKWCEDIINKFSTFI